MVWLNFGKSLLYTRFFLATLVRGPKDFTMFLQKVGGEESPWLQPLRHGGPDPPSSRVFRAPPRLRALPLRTRNKNTEASFGCFYLYLKSMITNTINDQNKTNLEIFPNQNKSTPSPQNSKKLKITIIILTVITLLITILTIVLVFCLKKKKKKKR